MADNWEDRLGGAVTVPSANWEDRLKGHSFTPPPSPTDSGSTLQFGPFDTGIELSPTATNFLAGAGKALVDTARGIGQKIGAVSVKDIEEARKLDAPLMDATAGKVGNFAGNVATALPTALVPGANTYSGAALLGAGVGLLQPSTSLSESAANFGLGAAGGAGGIAAGRLIGSVANTAKAAVQPFFKSGQDKIVGDTLRRFTLDPQTTAANLASDAPLIPGSNPTAGQVARDAGIAQLEQQVQQLDPRIAQMFRARTDAQNAARIAAVRGVAGDDAARQAAVEARKQVTGPLYDTAQSAIIPSDETLNALLGRPSASAAMSRATKLAAETDNPIKLGQDLPIMSGSTVQPASYTGRGLQYLKMGMDDLIDNPATSGIGKHELSAIKDTRGQLVDWLRQANPDYAAADAKYAEMSKPINQMDVGTALADKLIPAIQDFNATGGLNANAYARALRNGDQTARLATNYPNATLDNTMSPDQMRILKNVGEDLARTVTARNLASTPGSPTARNLVSQNIISGMAGPLGVPQQLASQNALLATLLRPAQFVGNLAEPQVLQRLGETLMEPAATAKALRAAQTPGLTDRLAQAILRYSPTASIVAQRAAFPLVAPSPKE